MSTQSRAVLLTATVFVALLVSAPAGAQTGDASIAGTVTGEGTPLADVTVCAVGNVVFAGDFVAFECADTDSSGAYRIDSLPDGEYDVRFEDAQPYVGEYYDDSRNQDGATFVTTSAISPATGIDADLALGHSVSGSVTDAAGDPIEVSVCVIAFDGLGVSPCVTSSASDGTWISTGHLAGPNFVSYLGREFLIESSIINIPGTNVTGLTAQLEAAGQIYGVVSTVDGRPINQMRVCRLNPDDDGYACTYTSASGAFGWGSLPADSYVLRVEDMDGNYETTYSGGADVEDEATPVDVVAGSVSRADFVLSASPSAVVCNNLVVTVDVSKGEVPTPEADVIRGTVGDDVIDGLGGNDIICSLQGNDTITGGSGFDKIFAGAGDDSIFGGSGNDRLIGGAGNDSIVGGAGNDRIQGGAGNDELSGGSGRDRLAGNSGNDILRGGKFDDELFGHIGRDQLFGNEGNDVLRGGAWVDQMDGGFGTNDGCTLTDPGGRPETRINCESGVFGR